MKRPRELQFKFVSFDRLNQLIILRMIDKDDRPNLLKLTIGEWSLIERSVNHLVGAE